MTELSTFSLIWRWICWFSLGIPLLAIGLSVRMGFHKTWYIRDDTAQYMRMVTAYGMFPGFLVMSLPPIILLLPITNELKTIAWTFVVVGGMILAFVVFPIWKPNFLKPAWLRRLESQYPPDAIEMFKHEWKKMNRDEWAAKIGTEEGMNELVKRVTDKYGEYDPERKRFVKTVTAVELSRPD